MPRLALLILLAFQTPILLSAQAPPLEVRWRGRIDHVSRHISPHGEIAHRYGVDVVWKERRVDVTAAGRAVGQVIVLEDDGSRWQGSVGGVLKSDVMTSTVSGTNTGVGQPVTGWLYRSAVQDDPVRDLDGAYGFASAGSGGKVDGTIVVTTSFMPPSTAPFPSGVQFHAGGGMTYPTLASASMTADQFRRVVEQGRAVVKQVAAVDYQTRALTDGAMNGAYTYQHPPGGLVIEMSWNIRRRLNLTGRLTETPEDWRPMLAGPHASLTASVDPALGIKGRFRFTLVDVSREPGYALNKGTGDGLDLRFADDQPIALGERHQTRDGWTVETTEALQSATINVVAFDYGAWGRLEAAVEVEGEWYECRLDQGDSSARIPFDRNTNQIADIWERDTGISRMEAAGDIDSGPTGANLGDGFSNYEEYRGFVVDGQWTATDPTIKELFVVDVNGIDIGDFGSSGITTLLIGVDEWEDDSRIVNFNRSHATAGPQKGLRLVTATLDVGTLGIISPLRVGTPNQVDEVRIDTEQLKDLGQAALDSTIAHEMGHAVNVQHHGHWELNSCGRGSDRRVIALWHGAHSGDQQCVMAYAGADYYKRADGHCREFTWSPVWGATFCTSPRGTGINGGPERTDNGHPMPVSGDAARGNCAAQLRLR